jgi:hypothetical protein
MAGGGRSRMALSDVRGVEVVGFREFTESRRPALELEEDFAPASAEPESERLGEFAVAVVGLDEPPHEGPRLLRGIGWLAHHGTVRPR